MPQKGRSRNTVPQRVLHKVSSRSAGAGSPSSSPILRPSLGPGGCIPLELGPEADDSCLPWPAELLCDVGRFFGFVELLSCEALARAARRSLTSRGATHFWERLCELHFPAMCRSVHAGGSSQGSSPSLGPRSPPLGSHSPPMSPTLAPIPAMADGADPLFELEVTEVSGLGEQQEEPPLLSVAPHGEHLPSSSLLPVSDLPEAHWKLLFAQRYTKQRRWDMAKRRGGSDVCGGVGHSGDFLPQDRSGWSAADLKALRSFVSAAWKDFGGVAALQNYRHVRRYQKGGFWPQECGFRGWGSHGHWAEGLGKRPAGVLRECLDGQLRCTWSCCGADMLIGEGCRSGAL